MFRLARISNRVLKPRFPRLASARNPFNTVFSITPTVRPVLPAFTMPKYKYSTTTPTVYKDDFCKIEFEEELSWWIGKTKDGLSLYIGCTKEDDPKALVERAKRIYTDLKSWDKKAKQFLLENYAETIAGWTEQEVSDITPEWIEKEFKVTGIDFDSSDLSNDTFLLNYTQKDIDETGHGSDVGFTNGIPDEFRMDG
jgi:hypothetical protein